jgi:predicted DCC family thiol-disulfide oxidoreductase YuxK
MQTFDVNQATLLYRATCKKCRILSRLVVVLSLGYIRRIPNNSPEAQSLFKAYQVDASKVILIKGDKVYIGFRSIIALLKSLI